MRPTAEIAKTEIGDSRRSSSADLCENEMVAAAGHALC